MSDELNFTITEALNPKEILEEDDFSDNENGRRVGPLYDVIYDALCKVVSGEAVEMEKEKQG